MKECSIKLIPAATFFIFPLIPIEKLYLKGYFLESISKNASVSIRLILEPRYKNEFAIYEQYHL
jgi:hypothetical protein